MTYRNGTFQCDTCSDYIETEEEDFDEALRAARAAGWRVYKGPDKEWAHACPSCTSDHAKGRK